VGIGERTSERDCWDAAGRKREGGKKTARTTQGQGGGRIFIPIKRGVRTMASRRRAFFSFCLAGLRSGSFRSVRFLTVWLGESGVAWDDGLPAGGRGP